MKRSSSENNSLDIKRASRSNSRTKETTNTSRDQLATYKSITVRRQLGSQLDQLKFENYLKQTKLQKLIESTHDLKSSQTIIKFQCNTEDALIDIKAKCKEEQNLTESLNHIKSEIINRKNTWKHKVSEITELYEKFSIKHEKIKLAQQKALRSSEFILQKLEQYKNISWSDKNERKEEILSKKKIKSDLERDSNKMMQNIEKIEKKISDKRENFSLMIEKLQVGLNGKIKDKNEESNQEILQKINNFLDFSFKFHSSQSKTFREVVELMLENFFMLEESIRISSHKSESLSYEINEKHNLCTELRNEYSRIKDEWYMKSIDFREEDEWLNGIEKKLNEEETLVKVFSFFKQISNEMLIKLRQVWASYPDPKLYPFIQDHSKVLSSSPLPRSTTLTSIPRRREKKELTHTEKIDIMSEEIKVPNLEKFQMIQSLFKCEPKIINFFVSSPILSLFLSSDWLKHQNFPQNPNQSHELVCLAYSKSQNYLYSVINKNINQANSLFLYLKACIPPGFNRTSHLLINCTQQPYSTRQKLNPRFFIKSSSVKKLRKSLSPEGSMKTSSITIKLVKDKSLSSITNMICHKLHISDMRLRKKEQQILSSVVRPSIKNYLKK